MLAPPKMPSAFSGNVSILWGHFARANNWLRFLVVSFNRHDRLNLHPSHHGHFIHHTIDKVSLNKKEMWATISVELYRQEKQENHTY